MNKILEKRKEKNMSIKDLSSQTGISERYLRFIEKGKRTPSLKTAISISKALGFSINELFDINLDE